MKKDVLSWGMLLLVLTLSVCEAKKYDELRKDIRKNFEFVEIEDSEVDYSRITPHGRTALQMPGMKWQVAETEHFYVHYERKMFAVQVARLAEFLYQYIGEELQVEEERFPGRSHIFIFEDDDPWRRFLFKLGTGQEWMGSFVYGPDLFLQRIGRKQKSMSILAHEMTHMVIFRFFGGPVPLWLNEGLAEWYREFGYSAFKGVYKSKKSPFKALKKWMPPSVLLVTRQYPRGRDEIEMFYRSSKYLVGFLLLEYPSWKMNEFIRVQVDGTDTETALNNVYGIAGTEYLEKNFKSFAR
jgi:hypothetical protein